MRHGQASVDSCSGRLVTTTRDATSSFECRFRRVPTQKLSGTLNGKSPPLSKKISLTEPTISFEKDFIKQLQQHFVLEHPLPAQLRQYGVHGMEENNTTGFQQNQQLGLCLLLRFENARGHGRGRAQAFFRVLVHGNVDACLRVHTCMRGVCSSCVRVCIHIRSPSCHTLPSSSPIP